MRIGIEARMMGAENTRGLGRYIQELVSAMLEVEPENEYVLVTRNQEHALASHPRIRTVVADVPWYSVREQVTMPRILKGLHADVVHVPHWNVPLSYGGPLVVTIHDLLLLHQPSSANASTRSWPVRFAKSAGFRATIRHAINSARVICVPTEFVKRDLLTFFPQADSKIIVTGEGISNLLSKVESSMSQVTDVSPFQPSTLNLKQKFLLYVGSAYPHKRLDLLLSAWKHVSTRYPDMDLVIAGEADAFMHRAQTMVEADKLPHVEFLGRVTDSRLASLYRDALALAWPSSFEGFGLTPVEALMQGCPVISSDAACMPEVLGNKGVVYFNSGSRDGIIDAINTVVDNLEKYRKEAKEIQSALSERHSWKKAAALTLSAYRRV